MTNTTCQDSNFTLKEFHRPPGWKCLCHTSAIVVSCAHKQIVNSIYKACWLKNAGAGIKRAKTWQWWLANSEWVYISHTTNRIPTQTRIPFCFTSRVHDLSHAGLSCIPSTHEQEFKAHTRKKERATIILKLTVQPGKSHTLCADEWAHVAQNRRQTHPERMLWHG